MSKTEGKIFQSREGKKIFIETEGEMYWNSEGENSKFSVDDLKKRSSEISADENQEIFLEKVEL